MKNTEIIFAHRPQGIPKTSDFLIQESTYKELEDGQFRIRTMYLSVDPYMRGRMTDTKSYIPPFELGKVIEGGIVGDVVESRNLRYQVGDLVTGQLPWRLFNVINGDFFITKLDPHITPPSLALGLLGIPGLTAYLGLVHIGNPKPGETVVISGAAGAVGSIVGQIAKQIGCRVIGIAGSNDKLAYLKEELGFDDAINYKDQASLSQKIRQACPNGVDVYFDNVGGEVSEAVIYSLNDFARIPLCGQIAHYNDVAPAHISMNVFHIFVTRRTHLQGFIVTDFSDQFSNARAQLIKWYSEGKIKIKDSIVEGFEHTPEAFIGLFQGQNVGKLLVKTHPTPSVSQ